MTTADDDDDLLGPEPGSTPSPASKPGRPRKSDALKAARKRRQGATRQESEAAAAPAPESWEGAKDLSSGDWQQFLQPVSVTFLHQVFRLDRQTVKKRLADLEPVRQGRGNTPLYDFNQAAQYLVTPKFDVREVVKKMSPSDLPADLSKDYWDARLKQQKWEEQAGQLWRTSAVVAVLGNAFQTLKTTTQLWVDQIAEDHELSSEVRGDLVNLVDGLQSDLHRALVEMAETNATESLLAEEDFVSDEASK